MPFRITKRMRRWWTRRTNSLVVIPRRRAASVARNGSPDTVASSGTVQFQLTAEHSDRRFDRECDGEVARSHEGIRRVLRASQEIQGSSKSYEIDRGGSSARRRGKRLIAA